MVMQKANSSPARLLGVLGYLVEDGWSCREPTAHLRGFRRDPSWHHWLQEPLEAPWERAPQR